MFDGLACQERPDRRRGFSRGKAKRKLVLAGSQLCVVMSMSCCMSVDSETPEQLPRFVYACALFSFRSLASARGQVVCFPHQEFPLALFAVRTVVISLVWWQSLYYTPIYFFIKICGERLQNDVVVSVFLLFSLFRCFFLHSFAI